MLSLIVVRDLKSIIYVPYARDLEASGVDGVAGQQEDVDQQRVQEEQCWMDQPKHVQYINVSVQEQCVSNQCTQYHLGG